MAWSQVFPMLLDLEVAGSRGLWRIDLQVVWSQVFPSLPDIEEAWSRVFPSFLDVGVA